MLIMSMVLSGGPKAGKTRLKRSIKEFIEKVYGFKVLMVAETATEVIESDFIPDSRPIDGDPKKVEQFINSTKDFQGAIFDLQMTKRAVYRRLADAYQTGCVILYDRELMDNEGYLMMKLGNDEFFMSLLAKHNITVEEIMNEIGLVISLGTSATIREFKEATADDKTIRIEGSGSEAEAVDFYVSRAWAGHPNYVRIEATATFEEKELATLMAIGERLDSIGAKKIGPYIKPD